MFQIQTIRDGAFVGHLDVSFYDNPGMAKPLTFPPQQIAYFPFAVILMFTIACKRLLVIRVLKYRKRNNKRAMKST
jgi:hypothetical protein